jgi:DNA-binding Lrp family transcriptional regulator
MSAPLAPLERALIDGWQRDFPLCSRPYREIADELGADEEEVLAALARMSDAGLISRIGAAVRPNTAGASLLAAMRVPAGAMVAVAEIINQEPGVNHNYEREHAINLWFVVTGRDRGAVSETLARIRRASGFDILELPLERAYYIDLGFPLSGERSEPRRVASNPWCPAAAWLVDAVDRDLLALLGEGLTVEPSPYLTLARGAGIGEAEAIERLGRLQRLGVIARFGLIVRHRALGFRANAMTVWDVSDSEVDRVGERLAAEPCVSLCYRRPRRLPDWPFNLFCMVHGRDRDIVKAQVAELTRRGGLEGRPHAVLFSRRCFRQRGAHLAAA